MSERTLRVIVVAMSVSLVGAGGYLLGFIVGRGEIRAFEVAEDLVSPAADRRRVQVRRDGVRQVTSELAEFQARHYGEHGEWADRESVPVVTEGYTTTTLASPYRTSFWGVVVRDEDVPRGEHCAVMLGRKPAYVGGIVLRREGRVRCSWDLATRINGWLSTHDLLR